MGSTMYSNSGTVYRHATRRNCLSSWRRLILSACRECSQLLAAEMVWRFCSSIFQTRSQVLHPPLGVPADLLSRRLVPAKAGDSARGSGGSSSGKSFFWDGMRLIGHARVATILLAGGEGTRLGYQGPKVSNHFSIQSLAERYCDFSPCLLLFKLARAG